ncbi:S-formylglutathione hydrolase [Endozoicomonas montiporae]|uniref:S-formylglutathione hydrolase n=2 Tax=Endozoicomonas montiporae TaxID=1027273 RepID=A0A081N0T1_9GAMM|nr:S-formylglutathione hydrolase [Endozoicomonas montiporae]AMO54535.1 S-formylglutathione hydrolase [Endozoicomonas montiporae CL-33]KEQ12054.1 S-formylglutathione hydrolase [Endozoicomonas montiporae]
MEQLSVTKAFEGELHRYKHSSSSTSTDMVFAVYLPPQAKNHSVPVLYWLSGLTCTDENFTQKASAFRMAAKLGLAIVCPDTSPRGLELPGEHDSYDFGSGAGFYVDATQPPWSGHYRMYSYVADELPELIEKTFPVSDKKAISGHSMGGHGALVIYLRNPGAYTSVSAFSPIVHPSKVPWGQKAFQNYLGADKDLWATYDATLLIQENGANTPILIDQGDSDSFLEEQLQPNHFEAACARANVPLTLNLRAGYDHSYYFISSFIDNHLEFHARKLMG